MHHADVHPAALPARKRVAADATHAHVLHVDEVEQLQAAVDDHLPLRLRPRRRQPQLGTALARAPAALNGNAERVGMASDGRKTYDVLHRRTNGMAAVAHTCSAESR